MKYKNREDFVIKNIESYLAIGYEDLMNFDYEMELKNYSFKYNKNKTSYDLENKLKSWFKYNNPEFVALSSGIDSNLALSIMLEEGMKPKILHFGAYYDKGTEFNYVKQIVSKFNLDSCLIPIKEFSLIEILDYFKKNNIIFAIDNLIAFDLMFKEASKVYKGGKVVFMQGADTMSFNNSWVKYNYFYNILKYSPIKKYYANIYKNGPIWASYERCTHSYNVFKSKGYIREASKISNYYNKIQEFFLSNSKNLLHALLLADIHLVKMIHFEAVNEIAKRYNFELITPFYDFDIASILINSLNVKNIINPNKKMIVDVFKRVKKHDLYQFGKGANISYKMFNPLEFSFKLKKYYLDLK